MIKYANALHKFLKTQGNSVLFHENETNVPLPAEVGCPKVEPQSVQGDISMRYLLTLFLMIPYLALFLQGGIREGDIGQVVRRAAELTKDIYVHPDVGRKVHDGLLGCLEKGIFDQDLSEEGFAGRLTDCLYRLSKDKHMRVVFDPRRAKELESWEKMSQKAKEGIERRRMERASKENFGFKKIQIMEGNIGYLDLEIFDRSDPALETGGAAMKFLSHTDAVILDLRSNRGGHPRMVKMIAACFIKGRVHLNTILDREGRIREEIWIQDDDTRTDLSDCALYILAGPRTASAAESFTYMMKSLGRAVVVGQPTAGAANPGGFYHAGGGYLIFIPSGQSISPFTGTNWEGIGIDPDIRIPEGQALQKALSLAAAKLKKGKSNDRNNIRKKQEMDRGILLK